MLSLFAFGCSANVATSAEVDAESSTAAAIVAVERTTGDNPRTEAVARFVRGHGPLDEQAARWVGLEPDLPAIGSCAPVATEVPSMPAGGVRLLDVGRVTLNVDPATPQEPNREPMTADLARRRLPDVVDVVSGVVYTASDLDLPARGRFEVRAVGEPELGAVRARADFAGEPNALRIQAQDAANPVAITLSNDAAIDVSWDAGPSDDIVYVDVADARKSGVTRCVFADVGHAALPVSAFGAGLEGDGTLTVHRMHRTNFRTASIERGELRLDFARELAFTLRQSPPHH
jgi:hypothetical protein